jgi:hypothetical protein
MHYWFKKSEGRLHLLISARVPGSKAPLCNRAQALEKP